MGRRDRNPRPVVQKKEENFIYSYFLKNLTGTMLMLNTGLLSKLSEEKGRKVSLNLMGVRSEYNVQAVGGYSSKELYESPGVLRHVKKKLIRPRIHKQSVVITTK